MFSYNHLQILAKLQEHPKNVDCKYVIVHSTSSIILVVSNSSLFSEKAGNNSLDSFFYLADINHIALL